MVVRLTKGLLISERSIELISRRPLTDPETPIRRTVVLECGDGVRHECGYRGIGPPVIATVMFWCSLQWFVRLSVVDRGGQRRGG